MLLLVFLILGIPKKLIHNYLIQNFFFLFSVRTTKIYKLMKPHIETLLKEIIFPMLCFNEENHKLWNEDPQEYVRREYGKKNFLKF